jgi:mannose-6-phosphate isomerase-like protein (cupin superfamily)
MGGAMAYDISTDVKFRPLEHMAIRALADATQPWANRSLCRVNDCVVRLGVVHGDFHWHKHDAEDEFFYVLEGRWLIDLEDRPTVELRPGDGFVVPKGVVHRTRAPERTVLLMVEGSTVTPTGDA